MILDLILIVYNDVLLVIKSKYFFLYLIYWSFNVLYSGNIHKHGDNIIISFYYFIYNDNSPFFVINGRPITPIISPRLNYSYYYDFVFFIASWIL